MKKRLYGFLIILSVIAAIVSDCKSPVKNATGEKPDYRWLEEMTISQLQSGYKEGKYSIVDVVTAYLARIEEIDRNGPKLSSVLVINPEALAIAKELDREMASGKIRGPLHGVPVIIKDNIDTKDQMPTTAGATALRRWHPGNDSFIAAKLREAGAVIIGKSNLSEWANFRSSVSTSGWSGVGGLTKNPYVLDRNPCGSSSGSGVAVSANLCMVAVGTETDGSILCPSNNNGIVGIKPTVGLLSRSGIIPISFTQDTPGPMSRTVEDAAICLGAMTGIDPGDSRTMASEGNFLTDYTKYLKADGLKGKRIGLLKDPGAFSEKVRNLLAQAVKTLIANGAVVVEVEAPPANKYREAEFRVLLYEFKDGLNKYLAGLDESSPVRNLSDLIEFNKKDTIELRYFGQDILIMAEKMGDLNSLEYLKALHDMLKATRDDGIDKMMNSNRLDALIAPTAAPAWKTDLVNGDRNVEESASLAAIAGYPSITVPMGFIGNLPVGISFFGRAWSEPVLIEIAYGYEQVTRHRKAPLYLVTD